MRKFGEIAGFTVISFNPVSICGGVFDLRAGSWKLTRTASRKLSDDRDGSAQWRELGKELHGGDELILLTGAVPNGVFFTFDSIALPAREQREALMMELPRQLLSPQDDPVIQFMPSGAGDSAETQSLNVYTVERKSLDALTATLRRGRVRADELVHPLLMTRPDDPAAHLPGIDPGFYFRDRRFHRVGNDDEARRTAEAEWRKKFAGCFDFDIAPGDFQEFFPVLLVARGVIEGDFRRHRKELQLLPKEVRPVRFRGQLRLTALLLALLFAVLLWRFASGRWQDFQEYRRIVTETKSLKNRIAQMQRANSGSAKEQKEMAKALNAVTARSGVLDDLAAISKQLPGDVMVSDFRWSEGEISLTIQSENENLDLTTKFAPRWRISDMQHRNARQSAITVINVKLVPADRQNGRSSKNGKGAKGARNRKR